MRKGSRVRRKRAPKSCQVHFWVDRSLLDEFDRIAGLQGEARPDAHRAALRHYVDRHTLEGAAFVLETEILVGPRRVRVRAFSAEGDAVMLRLEGVPVHRLFDLAAALQKGGAVKALPRTRSDA